MSYIVKYMYVYILYVWRDYILRETCKPRELLVEISLLVMKSGIDATRNANKKIRLFLRMQEKAFVKFLVHTCIYICTIVTEPLYYVSLLEIMR